MQRSSMLAVMLGTLVLTGCLPHVTQHASSNFKPMLEEFPYRTNEPLARELRYTYTEGLPPSRRMLDVRSCT